MVAEKTQEYYFLINLQYPPCQCRICNEENHRMCNQSNACIIKLLIAAELVKYSQHVTVTYWSENIANAHWRLRTILIIRLKPIL